MSELPIVQVRDLSKTYGTLTVLDHIDLDIAPGTKVAIIGPSGSGKSTLLRLLMTLERPDTGTIRVDDEYLWHLRRNGALQPASAAHTRAVRSKLGMVFQHFNLFPHMTVLRNVTLAPREVLHLPRDEAEARAVELLRLVGLEDKLDAYPAQLSGGQKQRVAIARALATGADLLLLDEPFAALDPATRAICRTELALLRKSLGLTVLEVTHALEEAGAHADRVVVLDRGRVVADGPYGTLAAHPPDLGAARALGLENLFPADLAGGTPEAWCFVPPADVFVGPPGIAIPPGILACTGTVETIAELGPLSRVRLLVDRPSGQVRLTGFAPAGTGPLTPGARATARFPANAVRHLPV